MPLHGRSLGPKLMQVSGLDLSDTSKTATFDTDWVGLGGAQYIAIWIKYVETVDGTWDIDFEVTPDAGTTVFDMPQDIDVETLADFTQITDSINTMRYYRLPPSGADSNMQLRLELTAGSSPTGTFKIWYSLFFPG